MLFNSIEFVGFFCIVFIVYWLLSFTKKLTAQNIFLLLSSYIFYAAWDYRFLGLILFSSLVDYICGLRMNRLEDGRKKYLILSICVNLGLLGFFKYFNFFIGEFSHLLELIGLNPGYSILNIVLPVGISFYTFQSMSYTIDVYRKKIGVEPNILNFLLYVSFFPQLVAGPIERAANLLPQIKNHRKFDLNNIFDGCWLIFFGYFLKIFMADNLAFVVEESFNSEVSNTLVVLGGVYAFAMQIFGDFAGYTFIAIGVAKLMGFDLMTNFLYPYFVTNPSEFWRNWHISLSTWLKDYLYIPLGGNRLGKLFTLRNLMITMLLGGLWHGAAWNFVLWGFYHGLLLVIYRQYKSHFDKIPKVLSIIIMFHFVCFGWLIFRVENMDQLYVMVASLGNLDLSAVHTVGLRKVAFFATLPMLINFFQFKTDSENYINTFYRPIRILLYVLMYFLLFGFGEFGVKEFIYFQF